MAGGKRKGNIHSASFFAWDESQSDNDFVPSGFRAVIHWLIQPGKDLTQQISALLDALDGRGDVGIY